MANLKQKKIIILNDSPIQSKDLKKYLEQEHQATIHLAETFAALEKILIHHNIDLVLAEFTMPKNLKSKTQKLIQKLSKTPVNYLIVNTRIILSKNRKNDDEELFIFSRKMIEQSTETVTSENNVFDISQKVSELYPKDLSLNILNNNKSIPAEFLELRPNGLLLALPEKIELNKEYCFTLKNFLNTETEYILYGTAKEIQESAEENDAPFFIISIQIREADKNHWNELLKKIKIKQNEANDFIKKANGR